MQPISLPDVMSDLVRNDTIEVTYESIRSEETQCVTGIVKRCIYRKNGKQQLKFNRHDGQKMLIKGDGNIYSVGSHHPLTGSVTDIEIRR